LQNRFSESLQGFGSEQNILTIKWF